MLKVCADERENRFKILAGDQEFPSDGPKLYPNPAASDHGHERRDVFIYPRTFLHIFQISWHCGACWWWQVHLTLAEKFQSRPNFPRIRGSSCCALSVGGRRRLLLLRVQLSGRLVYSWDAGTLHSSLGPPKKVKLWALVKSVRRVFCLFLLCLRICSQRLLFLSFLEVQSRT